jgi:hypothetical protein
VPRKAPYLIRVLENVEGLKAPIIVFDKIKRLILSFNINAEARVHVGSFLSSTDVFGFQY